ncbi:hypothetical protein MKW98_022584, partial [Papaver atlanticum]
GNFFIFKVTLVGKRIEPARSDFSLKTVGELGVPWCIKCASQVSDPVPRDFQSELHQCDEMRSHNATVPIKGNLKFLIFVC